MNSPVSNPRPRERHFLPQLRVVLRSPARRAGWMVLSLLGAVAWAEAADSKWVLPAETARLRAGPGQELADARCLVCHSADYISTQPRLSRGQWQAAVQKMQQKYGAVVSTNESGALVNYLVKSYGAEPPATNSVPRR